MKLEGAVAIVTGASRGLGKAVASRFAGEGARVVVCSSSATAIGEAGHEIQRTGASVLALKADVSSERDVDRLVTATLKEFGRIDVLVNNAGLLTPKTLLHEIRINDWDHVMAVNLRGPFLCLRLVLPRMLAQQSGSIINVSSGAGQREAPLWGPYAVSKFGLEGLTALVAAETRGHGVRVNAVNPGAMRTPMRAMAYPNEDPATLPLPHDLTGVFVYLASDASREVTGQSIDARAWVQKHKEWR